MKTILTAAVTGAHTTRKQNPNLPVTPEEIANSALECATAGAAIVHLHARDPNSGVPSMQFEHYQEIVERIRDKNTDLLINLTTGPGDTGPIEAVHTGSNCFKTALERVEHVLKLKPDICSLDFNTMNFGTNMLTVNSISTVREMAKLIRDAGVRPECEIFDSGDMIIMKSLINDGLIVGAPMVQIATGVKWGWPSEPETIGWAKSIMPADSIWTAFGVGLLQMPFAALSSIHGGHVRVGLEDNVFISRRVLAKSNAQLVLKARRIIEDIGNTLATPSEARAILKINRIDNTSYNTVMATISAM
jgi:uncharacterized protein (DUF849 family)